MSSMLNPFKRSEKPALIEQRNDMDERIPNYAESSTQSTLQTSSLLPPQQLDTLPLPSDEPPAYTALDPTQTTFMIYGTFIHTPSGPAYQLSTPLDQRGPFFRIRRLRPREAAQVGAVPISFDKTHTLYEVNDPPLLDYEYHIRGKRGGCLPGVLELKFKLNKWHVKHVPHPNSTDKGKDILTSKRVSLFGLGRTTLNRKREEEASEWKDAQGRVLATEVLKKLEDGGVVPVIELEGDLDQQWRELLLSVWAARLWVAFGKEKTVALGGRLNNGQWAKLSGAGILGGGWGLVGGVVVAT